MKLGLNKVKVTWSGFFFLRGLFVKIGFFRYFLRNCSLKFPIFCMILEGNRELHMNMTSYLGKALIQELRGIRCRKFCILARKFPEKSLFRVVCQNYLYPPLHFGPRVYPRGSYLITLARPSVSPCLNISETALRIFNFLHEVSAP